MSDRAVFASWLMAFAVAVVVGLFATVGVATGVQQAWAEVMAAGSDELAQQNDTVTKVPESSLTAWTGDYEVYGSTVKSHLALNGEGNLERVEYIQGTGLVVEQYNPEKLQFVSGKIIDPRTYRPSGMSASKKVLWGGYYRGVDANYVVTGQVNESESDDVPVVRVTAYTSDWKYDPGRVLELKGINTYVPFDAGSCSLAEDGNGNLWIRTCHEMYQSADGKHHQANMTFVIDEGQLQVMDSLYEVSSLGYDKFAYVSHSFNQFLAPLGDAMYAADHGDAHPRAFVLSNLDGSCASTCPLVIAGEAGNNITFAGLGGLAASATANTLVMAGNSADQSTVASANTTPHNVWVSFTEAFPSVSGDPRITVKWLTGHTPESGSHASVPALVKVDDGKFMAIWGTEPFDPEEGRSLIGLVSDEPEPTYGAQVSYQFFDGEGNELSDVRTMRGVLGDCQPIVCGGKVVWYATGTPASFSGDRTTYVASAPAFYGVDADTMQAVSLNPFDTADITLGQDECVYTGSQVKPQVRVAVNGATLVQGTHYTVEYGKNVNAGTGTVTIRGMGSTYDGYAKLYSFRIKPAYIGDAQISFDYVQKYTGKAVKPKVTAKFNGKALVQGTDFTVDYQDNVEKGYGIVWVHGKGNFGRNEYPGYYFVITDGIDLAKPGQVKVAQSGAANFKVTWAKVAGATGYDVYRNGVWVASTSANSWTDTSAKANGGKYSYQVVAVSDYDTSAKSAAAVTYYVAKGKVKSAKSTARGQVVAKWAKNAKASGYQLRYTVGKTAKTAAIKKPATVKKVLKKLKPGKTYKIKVRAYRKVGAKTYYGAWSAAKKVKVMK